MVAVHALVLVVLLSACRRGEIIGGVSDSAFVGTMAALERINANAGMDSAARAAARMTVLQSRGLDGATLERAARALATDPDRALAIWRAITMKAAQPAEPAMPAGDQPGPARVDTSR
jgi:hypothetical protein